MRQNQRRCRQNCNKQRQESTDYSQCQSHDRRCQGIHKSHVMIDQCKNHDRQDELTCLVNDFCMPGIYLLYTSAQHIDCIHLSISFSSIPVNLSEHTFSKVWSDHDYIF